MANNIYFLHVMFRTNLKQQQNIPRSFLSYRDERWILHPLKIAKYHFV